MKQKRCLFLAVISLMLIIDAMSPVIAMDLAARHLDADDAHYPSANRDASNNDLLYPGRISLILGYSYLPLKNARLQNLQVVPVNYSNTNLYNYSSAALSGVTLGINQFLSRHFGYELNLSYYLPHKSQDNYTGNYSGNPDFPNIVNSTGTVSNTTLTTELLGMLGLHLSDSTLIVAKLGLGYARLNQTTSITSTYSEGNDTYVPYSSTASNNKLGLAGGVDFRWDINDNFSAVIGVNDLHAHQNFLAYQAGLLLRL